MTFAPVNLPYGSKTLPFFLPHSWHVEHAEGKTGTARIDLVDTTRDSLLHPIAGPRLRELARPGMQVVIAVTDATRPVPNDIFLGAILDELHAAGVADDTIRVVIALGMHRKCTAAERSTILGPAQGRVTVEDAQGAETDAYVALDPIDATPFGVPVSVPVHLRRSVVAADLLISTGIVEPHQYAGFSGGRKTVAIGCAAQATIKVLHSIPFLEAEGTRLARLEGNPLHGVLEAIAAQAGVRFALNLARDPQGNAVRVAAGEPGPVLRELVEHLEPLSLTPVQGAPFDAVLAGVGAPKDANLYQASRAFTYLAFSPQPVLRPGAWVILTAETPEGAGEGPGELEFRECMESEQTPQRVVAALRAGGFGAGGQRAFMVAQALSRFRCGVVGSRRVEAVRACRFEPFPNPDAAVRRLEDELPENPRVLVVPHGLATLPIPASDLTR